MSMRMYIDNEKGVRPLQASASLRQRRLGVGSGNARVLGMKLPGWAERNQHAHLQRQPEGLAASAGVGIVQAAPLRLQV